MNLGILASSFGAGFLVSLSPCVFPMIPIILGYFGTQAGTGKKSHIFAFTFGQILTFVGLGFAAVQLGEVFGFSSQDPIVQIVTGCILLLFGLFSFFSFLPSIFSKWNGLAKKVEGEGSSLVASLFLGISAALVSSPCSTPILGSILLALATEGSVLQGSLSMLSFALGASSIFLAVGLGVINVKVLPKRGPWMKRLHQLGSLLILAMSLYYLVKGVLAYSSAL